MKLFSRICFFFAGLMMLFMLVRGSWQSCLADARQVAVEGIPVETKAKLNEFAKNAPATTILISYDQVNKFENMTIEIPDDKNGFSSVDSLLKVNGLHGDPEKDDHPFVTYSPKDDKNNWPNQEVSKNKYLSLSSQDQPLFSFRFKDAAKLANGEHADLVVMGSIKS